MESLGSESGLAAGAASPAPPTAVVPSESGVPPAGPVAMARKVSARTVGLIVASAMFMEQLDGTVLATALPTMAKSFHADPLRMNVALTSYLLSLAVFIPASGKMADRFGSRTVFRTAIGLFVLGSILCGQANTLPFLVASRILQGIGGAMMSPVGRLVLLRAVSKAELVTAMAWLMIPATIGPIVGPPVGGFIVTYLSWRWIFYMNVPIGIAGIVLVSLFIEETRAEGPVRFDLRGLALSGTALACLMFGIEMASRGVGSVWLTATLVVVGVVAGFLYWRHARVASDPMLDLKLMRIATFRMSVLCGAFSRIGAGSMPFLMPMMLQLGFGDSAAQSGLITFASSIGTLAMRVCAPRLLRIMGFRNVLIWIGALAVLLLGSCGAFRPSWPVGWIYAVLIAGGFVQSLQFMAYNTIAYADIPRLQMSAATSFYTTFQQMSLTLGIAVSAASLAGSMAVMRHGAPLMGDFTAAFVIVAIVSMCAPLLSTKLEKGAGAELSGQRAG